MNWTFHIFTHGKDEFTTDIYLAMRLYHKFIRQYGCARLYIQIYLNDKCEGDPDLEDCILSKGEFPT